MATSSSILISSGSSSIVFEGGEAAIVGKGVTGVVKRGRLQQGGHEEMAVKMAFVGDPSDPAWVKKEAGMKVEEDSMRQAAGRPPFIDLLASNTDSESPAIVTDTDGTTRPALCIASPLLSGDKWVELSEFFGWEEASPGSEGKTKHNLVEACDAFDKEGNTPRAREELWRETIIITRALLLVLEAHEAAYSLGMLHLDGFYNNIMLPRAALESPTPSASAASAAAAADDGDKQRAKAIDLVNVIVAKARSEHPTPPPEHSCPFAALVPTDPQQQRQQRQLPAGTTTFTPPEVQALLSGPPSVEGAVWLGEPSLAWSFCMLIYAAALGRPMGDVLLFLMDQRLWRTDEKLSIAAAREVAEEEMLSEWERFTQSGKLVNTSLPTFAPQIDGLHPNRYGYDTDERLFNLGEEQGVEWLAEWRKMLTAIAYMRREDEPGQTGEERGGLVADQSRRSTLKEIREPLEAVLAFLKSPEVLDAVQTGTPFELPEGEEGEEGVDERATMPQGPVEGAIEDASVVDTVVEKEEPPTPKSPTDTNVQMQHGAAPHPRQPAAVHHTQQPTPPYPRLPHQTGARLLGRVVVSEQERSRPGGERKE
ncbi:unnamed protein product [Vitrella brassicaformis CCMP3155]|uniref:Protein kinase domain-containing protein n=1 Tax=Vitrella brassicaformis (strain CCMP3155) TaxID=1169540 RepID=A0A0G4GX10_VITBC|nr:unnamed protein product [Vitrella brassicaformis CCMP3155]|eukprot:CEM35586.1 unnamed protein product [Vitrella brassicaformis CCMP3155]